MGRKLPIFLIWIAVVSLVSGCAMSPAKRKGLLIGAGAGALVGGGIGCGVASAQTDSDDGLAYEIGCPAGVVGGALIGGALGYLIAQEAPPPPPPPPPPPVAERIVLRGVHFDFDRVNVRPDAVPILDEAADILGKHPDVTVASMATATRSAPIAIT